MTFVWGKILSWLLHKGLNVYNQSSPFDLSTTVAYLGILFFFLWIPFIFTPGTYKRRQIRKYLTIEVIFLSSWWLGNCVLMRQILIMVSCLAGFCGGSALLFHEWRGRWIEVLWCIERKIEEGKVSVFVCVCRIDKVRKSDINNSKPVLTICASVSDNIMASQKAICSPKTALSEIQ